MKLPMWLGYFIEQFPLISNLYTVQYQIIQQEAKQGRPSSVSRIAILNLRKHPFYALLHDVMNPLRVVNATLNTLARVTFSTIDIIKSKNKVVNALAYLVTVPIVLTFLIPTYFIGQLDQLPISYQTLNFKLSGEEDKAQREESKKRYPLINRQQASPLTTVTDDQSTPLPLRSVKPSEKGIFNWLYQKIRLKGGTLHTQQTEYKLKNMEKTLKKHIDQKHTKTIELQKEKKQVADEEQFENPSLIFGIIDIPYQVGRYIGQCLAPDPDDEVKKSIVRINN